MPYVGGFEFCLEEDTERILAKKVLLISFFLKCF